MGSSNAFVLKLIMVVGAIFMLNGFSESMESHRLHELVMGEWQSFDLVGNNIYFRDAGRFERVIAPNNLPPVAEIGSYTIQNAGVWVTSQYFNQFYSRFVPFFFRDEVFLVNSELVGDLCREYRFSRLDARLLNFNGFGLYSRMHELDALFREPTDLNGHPLCSA